MRKYLLVLFVISALVISACQKEIDWGFGGGGAGQLLVKIHSKTGTDSTIITYSYDAQNRLIAENTVGASGGTVLDMNFTINRNASGIITTTVQKSAALAGAGIDSLVTRYYYDAATSRYKASAFDISIGGFGITDSAVYTYDGSGRITSELHWLASGIIPAFEALKNQYTYSGNGLNLINLDILAATNPGDPLSLIASETFTFDSKNDPLILKNEAILLGRHGFYNANNPTKVEYLDATDPSQNFTYDYTYKYNAAGKPDSSYNTQTPAGTVTASKYFYQ